MPTETAVPEERREAVRRWLYEVTEGATQAEVSRQSAVKPTSVSKVMNAGSAEPMQLAKLARAYGRSAVEVFLVAGWLTEDEAKGLIPEGWAARNDEEAGLLKAFRRAESPWKRAATAMLREAAGQNQAEPQSAQAGL